MASVYCTCLQTSDKSFIHETIKHQVSPTSWWDHAMSEWSNNHRGGRLEEHYCVCCTWKCLSKKNQIHILLNAVIMLLCYYLEDQILFYACLYFFKPQILCFLFTESVNICNMPEKNCATISDQPLSKLESKFWCFKIIVDKQACTFSRLDVFLEKCGNC